MPFTSFLSHVETFLYVYSFDLMHVVFNTSWTIINWILIFYVLFIVVCIKQPKKTPYTNINIENTVLPMQLDYWRQGIQARWTRRL